MATRQRHRVTRIEFPYYGKTIVATLTPHGLVFRRKYARTTERLSMLDAYCAALGQLPLFQRMK